MLEQPWYNPIRDSFPSLFDNVVPRSLKSFFQLHQQVDISLYLTEVTALKHPREFETIVMYFQSYEPFRLPRLQHQFHFYSQLVFEILWIKLLFSNFIFTLHMCFIVQIWLSVFYFEWYSWGDPPMFLEIKLLSIIYNEICSILYYFIYLFMNTCSLTWSQE